MSHTFLVALVVGVPGAVWGCWSLWRAHQVLDRGRDLFGGHR